jgi:uncharacterized protein (TIGR02001 family)
MRVRRPIARLPINRQGLAGVILIATAAPALAEASGASEGSDVRANVAMVSDYRFRGLSLSNLAPAIQGSVEAETTSGFIASIWGSTIADYGGAHTEIDLYGGYTRKVADVQLAIGAYTYLYPGGSGVNYAEAQASARHDFGAANFGALVAYVPAQANVARENLYIEGNIEVPVGGGPLSARAAFGRETGLYDNKLNWEAGLSFQKSWGRATLTYVGTNYDGVDQAGSSGKATVVAGLSLTF